MIVTKVILNGCSNNTTLEKYRWKALWFKVEKNLKVLI